MCRIHNCLTTRAMTTLMLFATAITTCLALPNDSKTILHITSDTSSYNYKTGINEFVGHVILDQGTTHLAADRLITKSNAQHKIKEAIAYGIRQPAHYWTLPKPNDPEMHAYATIIKFYPIESNVALEQNVTVKQGDNSFQGQLIHYNSSDQTIIVPHMEKSQAVLVYNPDN